MSKVNKWSQGSPAAASRSKNNSTRKVEMGAVAKRSIAPTAVASTATESTKEASRQTITPFCNPAVDINMLSTVPFYSSRLQSMRSPFNVDKAILNQFNNFGGYSNMYSESGDCQCKQAQFNTGNPRITFTLGHAHDTPMGRRLNSKLFTVETAGYQLAMNGIVGAPLWLCVGDRVDIHYCPGSARRRQNCDAQQKDYLCLASDPFGGGPHSFTNEFSPQAYNPNFTPSLAAEPVFGTQKIYTGSTQTLVIAPWLAQGIYYMVESAAVGTFCPVVIMACCNK